MTGVLLLGKGSLAVKLAHWLIERPDFDLVGVVPVVPEPTWTESLSDWCRARDIPVVESGVAADAFGDARIGETIDLAISVFYDRILRVSFLNRCTRAVNLHNGPLPRYRGVSPINWALKNGESEHGITLHEITPGIDDGPVVAQVKYSIFPEVEEVVDVYERSLEHGWTLLHQTLPLLNQIVPRLQDESAATYYSRRDDAKLEERSTLRRPELHDS